MGGPKARVFTAEERAAFAAHYATRMTVEQIGVAMGLSRHQVFRLFRELRNVTDPHALHLAVDSAVNVRRRPAQPARATGLGRRPTPDEWRWLAGVFDARVRLTSIGARRQVSLSFPDRAPLDEVRLLLGCGFITISEWGGSWRLAARRPLIELAEGILPYVRTSRRTWLRILNDLKPIEDALAAKRRDAETATEESG